MIATYIQELLATNNRVIVPNYGAFLVRATSKSKDANTLEEKLKDIYFSPFLKFNDELLEKFIIKKEKITKEQAAEKIKQFIEDIKKELDQEKPYKIEGFGEFVADKQGKVQFITIAKPVSPASGKEKTKLVKEEKKTAGKTTTTKKPTSPVGKKEGEKTAPPTSKTEDKPKVEEVKKETKPTSTTSELKEFKPDKEAETKKVDAPILKSKEAEKKSIYSSKKEKKPINKGLVWSIAIGLPVAAIFIWALLNFDTVKKVFDKEKTKTEKVAKQKKATTKKAVAKKETTQTKSTDSAGEKKTSAKKATKPAAKKATTTQKKYYIIAGSFKNEKYATLYLTKLQTEGYNAEKLAKRDGMYAISYNSFADKRKAIAEYKFLVQEKQLQAWILYY